MPQQINVTRSSMPPFEEYVEEIRPLWESRWLTNMGEKHCQLEQQLAEKLGTGRVSLFTNGHMALELLLKAMGLEGEVLTTPFTFVSTTHAICRAGLTPVFCDVKESDGTLDPAKLEERITPRTCAILPVHVYGNLCDTEAIDAIAMPLVWRKTAARRAASAMPPCSASMPPRCSTPSRAAAYAVTTRRCTKPWTICGTSAFRTPSTWAMWPPTRR